MNARHFVYGMFALLGFAFSAQAQNFQGTVDGVFIDSVGGTVEGEWTHALTFIGPPNGSIRFDSASTYTSSGSDPFLLGSMHFTAGGSAPESATFQLMLDQGTKDNSCVNFLMPVTLTERREPGYRADALDFGPKASSATFLDGVEYTLSVAGFTSTPTWNPLSEGVNVVSALLGETSDVYFWARLTPTNQTVGTDGSVDGTEGSENGTGGTGVTGVPQVPEPSAFLLGVIGIGVFLGWRRIANKPATATC